jgi:hypothetical protein
MNFKQYLPFENYVLTSNLSVDEITKRLSAKIEPKKAIRLSGFNKGSTKPYEGEIVGDRFTISRIIDYRNSFIPVIKGRISTVRGKTQITIKMHPAIFVLILLSVWLGIVGIICLWIILAGLIQIKQVFQSGFSPVILIPIGMFVFGCLLTSLAFKGESKNSKDFLAQLFEGQENFQRQKDAEL